MSEYKGKNVAILGLSVEGVDGTRFFCNEKSRVTCCDRRTRRELGQTYESLNTLGVTFKLGPGYLSDLSSYDIVVRTPGMSLRLPELADRRRIGKEISSPTKQFFALCPAPIIGVTGTKGKGTTATLIYEILKSAGKQAYIGGNVGTPLLSRVRQIRRSDIVVLELSSFQLEDLTQSPHVAVVLRITQEHLDNADPLATNFHRSRQEYIRAKQSIVVNQTHRDITIINADDPTGVSFASLTPAHIYAFSLTGQRVDAYIENHTVYMKTPTRVQTICSAFQITLRGEHNLENIAAAALAAYSVGVKVDIIQGIAKRFKGLEHRLEDIRIHKGVLYVNDTFSTVPETTVAAISAFSDRPIILILGGSEKGSDFTQLGKSIASSSVKTAIAVGHMTGRIVQALRAAAFAGHVITGCRNMKEIVSAAYSQSQSGDVVLLSPACASFDMFANYKERGKLFKYEVSLL